MEAEVNDLSGKVVIGDKDAPTEKCEKIIAHVSGERHEVPYDGSSSILDTLINKGINAPYSCMDGACMACLGKIVKGKAYMDDLCILTDDNVQEGESLTCQAKPASAIVEVSYDDI